MAQAPAGWYPDPSGNANKLRYWDGDAWTDNYTDANPQSAAAQPGAAQAGAAQTTVNVYANTPGARPVYELSSQDQTLRLIAFILNLISTIACCWLIIPLAWMIPMTVHTWSLYKGTRPNTVAFGVCTLLFVNVISGILLLCSDKEE